ncbi:fatty-acid amide hydrolase 2-B-like isoform X2 [Odontomachus brunneus]|uniref:fatty-acid amide hydrolase 2-B-like isoform X2 n=1 Tax=Odontomachus brunneus TaxID=486640 RepID=UPI0013F1B5B0|nr:fatty-acid amide hydrolase 2-B-like isoform X2 [Odontomachus brunneus]
MLRQIRRDTQMEIVATVVRFVCKSFLFLLYCLFGPFFKLRTLKKRQQCTSIDNQILLLSATKIAQKIRMKKIRCEEVIVAYVERCKEVNPVLNAVVENRYETALREAREIDDFLKSTTINETRIAHEKPLLGVPITIKESIAVQGMSHSVGMKESSPSRATRDADVVMRIREAGGIPLLVSNTPELCLWWHTFNKVTGATRNPYDTRRTPGGSSGGEAALLGAGASLLSLCSDIAGSARLPAMFCGVFGHKPTPNWVSVEGHKPGSTDVNWPSYFAIGVMVRYAIDLPLVLTAISQSNEARIGFNKKVRLKDMRFFYMTNSGSIVTNSPDSDMKNAIHKLVKYLETTHGVKVQKTNFENMRSAFEISTTILLRLENTYSMFNRSDDPKKSKNAFLETLKYIFFQSSYTYPALLYGLLKNIGERFPRSYYNTMIEKKMQLKQQFEMLGNNGVLIYPSFISSAPYPHEIMYNACNFTYLMIFNTLGLPVTQCPLGFDKNRLPIGLQIVANPGCDHLTIAVAQEIERAFGGWQEPSLVEKKSYNAA